jgi:hypothetical protein
MLTLTVTEVKKDETARTELWDSVDGLIDRAPSLTALFWHGLQLLAARRLRAQGRHLDQSLLEEEHATGLRLISAPLVLERVRSAFDGTIVLMKGYEAALAYSDPALRPFVDVDLLVEDSHAAQRALLAAGFVEVGKPELFKDIHHQRPVWLPGFPLTVELHHEPKWPDLLAPSPAGEFLDAAVPSSSQVEGISTLPAAHHALVLAAHSWAHLPLRRIKELLDVAAVTEQAERGEINALARRFGISRVWRTTIGAVDSLFYGGPRTSAQAIWARHLLNARERTVFESHVQKWSSPFWTVPWYTAIPVSAGEVVSEFTPGEDEGWREKGARARRAFSNASLPRSEHDSQLGAGAHRWRRRR